MIKIFWVEDQFHWIDRFKSILENADFSTSANSDYGKPDSGNADSGNSESTSSEAIQENLVEVYRFEEAARHEINQSCKQKDFRFPDIIILDANMNGDDDAGLGLSKLINRTWPKIPIIFLSEHSGTSTEEKVFESGQTRDFIAKHQENIEKVLCWRIKALLRNAEFTHSLNELEPNQSSASQLKNGELLIDLVTWNVYWHGEKLMNPKNVKRPLAPTPRKILKYLVESSPHPLTTGKMEERLELDRFNYASYRQHIKTLRHSFENACKIKNTPSFIELCNNGEGIMTFGDEGAYCWKNLTIGKK